MTIDDDTRDEIWERGRRAAYTSMLQECCSGLGYRFDTTDKRWITEREQAIAALRSICEGHGDNDWDEKLHLADIIDKHLGRHLEE